MHSLWQALSRSLRKSIRSRNSGRRPRGGLRTRQAPWAAEVLESRTLLSGILVDTTPVMTLYATKSVPLTGILLMTFTDSDTTAVAGDYTVSSIDWGGTITGPTPNLSIVAYSFHSGAGKGWMVVADRVEYTTPGDYTVALTVRADDGGVVSSNHMKIDVGDTPSSTLTSNVNRLTTTIAATAPAKQYSVNSSNNLWEAAAGGTTDVTADFLVSWTGSSNVAKYSIYYSDNGSAYVPFIENTTLTSKMFTGGKQGHTYSFYSIAFDSSGNHENTPNNPEASTTVDTLSAYSRLAGLEGFYFSGSEIVQLLRSGDRLTAISASGSATGGSVTGTTQIAIGGLQGTYDRTDGVIQFADGTVWVSARQLAGQWLTSAGAIAGIQQTGTDLTLKNAQGGTSAGHFVSATQLVATDWNLTATLTSNGTRIRWSDGTFWDLIPELEGASANAQGNSNRVEQSGDAFVFVNRLGQTSAGRFIGQNLVMATDWGNIVGKLSGTSIQWVNGTTWTQKSAGTTVPDLGGLWDVGGDTVRIIQTNNNLTFINRQGSVAAGHFASATQVVADGWGNAQGVLSGNTLTWLANGVVWTRLPELDGAYLNGANQLTGVTQLGRKLTFTSETGAVSHATLQSATRFIETDGAKRTGTISGTTITFDGGPVWTQVPNLRGNWSVASSGAPVFIEQSSLKLLIVTDTGTILRGTIQSLTQAQLTASGSPAVTVEIVSRQLLQLESGTQWNRAAAHVLDAVFSDLDNWPYL